MGSKSDRLSPLRPEIQNEQKLLKSQVSALSTNIEQVREYLLSKKLHFEGGQIRHCFTEWGGITSDRNILEMVEGPV